jgi:uncharacterized protein YjbI with pentapeptide repeats
VLADGLRYAVDLRGVDLTRCNLSDAFLGIDDDALRQVNPTGRSGVLRGGRSMTGRRAKTLAPRVDLSKADLYEAVCYKASFRNVIAVGTVFNTCNLHKAVLAGADCTNADFRGANLLDADFAGARIGGARFAGATDIPAAVDRHLDDDGVAQVGVVVAQKTRAR